MFRKKSSFLKSNEFKNGVLELSRIKNKLLSYVSSTQNGIEYTVPQEIWEAFHRLAKNQMRTACELPEDWTFTYFSLKEFKEVWAVLLAKAQIHSMACLLSGKKGAGIESVVLVEKFETLCKDIASKTNLSYSKVEQILHFITYNPTIKNVDIIMQPLIMLDSSQVAISPHLIIPSNFERNLIVLINKVDQASYSRLSNNKENIMGNELVQKISKAFPNLKLEQKIQLPSPLPDMDLIIYDENTNVLFIGEMKWLIQPDSIQEVCSRDEDLAKGICQAKRIKDYVENNLADSLNRIFGDEHIKVKKIFTCVVSKNTLGTSALDRVVPIINEEILMQLITKFNGNLQEVVNAIEAKEYLPKLGKDFKIIKHKIKYAGYLFRFQAVEVIIPSEHRTRKKIGRNDPCPCGKINKNTGRPVKYKNCCGRLQT
ncbi:MAG TPA: hypothetical protein VIK77_12835 [Tissierellaceae bacterium]